MFPALVTLAGLVFATPALAEVHPGDTWLDFTKNRLDYPGLGQTTPVSMFEYSGKVVVLFLLGYD